MSIINPDPSDCALLLPWLGSWNCLKNSSKGDPGGKDGKFCFLSSMIVVVEILTTPAGNILKELFRCGVTVGISSRGMGSVEENSDGVLMVQEDFDLLCFDFVSTPSTPGAYMSPMNEGVSTPTTDYTRVNNVIRDIICDNTGMCKC